MDKQIQEAKTIKFEFSNRLSQDDLEFEQGTTRKEPVMQLED